MPYVKRASAALVMVLMPLNGCAKDNSEAVCLTVPTYSAAEQTRAADELTQMGTQPETGRMMADYGRMRDEARALCP